MMILLVENIGLFSVTADIGKIFKNIETIGWDYESTIAVNLLITPETLTAVNYFGRYICILQLNPAHTEGSMIFIDHTQFDGIGHLKTNIETANFHTRLMEMILQTYKKVKEVFSEKIDLATLSAG